ncbi:MAG: ApbE family protein [Planctomycetota bacterium]
MKLFLIALGVFGIAVAGMAVGLLRGRRLSGSCGGVGPDGESLADCLCEMQNAPVCDARKELLRLTGKLAPKDEPQREEIGV